MCVCLFFLEGEWDYGFLISLIDIHSSKTANYREKKDFVRTHIHTRDAK